ncbi:MAG TPA: twin-arginine translocase TatA/TatE family subunit [Bacteroidales bacterium]
MSGGEIFLILLAVLVLFGADKMPGIARGIGKGMREFQKAADEIKSELANSTSDIRNEMNNIRSDVQDNINQARQTVNETKNEFTQATDIKTETATEATTDESYRVYEEARETADVPSDERKIDPKISDKQFLDAGANI